MLTVVPQKVGRILTLRSQACLTIPRLFLPSCPNRSSIVAQCGCAFLSPLLPSELRFKVFNNLRE